MASVTNHLQIRNNPSNNSTAKHQWSFSKSNRFPTPKFYCNKSFYDQRSCLSQRKASIGIGSRTKFFDGNKQIPQPGKYQLNSSFDTKIKRGFSFTANRQNLKFDNYLTTLQTTPDPSTYHIDQNQVKANKIYSLRPKTAYPQNYFLPNSHTIEVKRNLPGPGKYETIDSIGKKYYASKSPNHNALTFHGGNRFKTTQRTTPGPQDYTDKTIEPDGIYLLSNMKSSGRRSFLSGKRNIKLDGNKQTPGPGNYRLPSQFGHYQQPINPTSTISTSKQKGALRPSTAMN